MIKISKIKLHYIQSRDLGMVSLIKFGNINQVITISLITLSGFYYIKLTWWFPIDIIVTIVCKEILALVGVAVLVQDVVDSGTVDVFLLNSGKRDGSLFRVWSWF